MPTPPKLTNEPGRPVGRVDRKRPVPPPLSDQQRRAAYEKALELRRQRRTVKVNVSNGGLPVLLIAWGAEAAQGMKVLDLLAALPRMGKVSATKLLEQAGFKYPEKTTVRATGPRQREALFKLLDTKQPRL